MNPYDDLDRMLSGGAKSAKFENAGDSIAGIITDIAVRQATEYGTGKPQTFDNGDPKEQIVVTIKADHVRADEDDDGHRSVYIKGWGAQRRAFIEAAKRDGKPGVGDRFTATLTGMQPSKTGGFPAKLFEYRIQHLEQHDPLDGITGMADTASAQQATRAQAMKLLDSGLMTHEQVAAATGLELAEVRSLTADTPF